jgi:hypothetical protein
MEIRAARIFPGRVSADILIVLDNSASMASKQEKVLKNLSKMMQVLQNLEGGMPDLHIGIVSTDLGAGMGEAGGDCAVPLGDRALLWGNDPDPGALATVAGGTSNGCGLAEGARWIESHPCPDGSGPAQNYRGELADVLSCMGRALGGHGCGYSHALQAARLALDPQPGLNEANRGFLRPKGYLLIFFISDKDDCSAPAESTLNDGLFSARNPGDNPLLRCAARGHVCDRQAIPNYHPSTGYDGTQGAWAFELGACAAKVPLDPPQASWLPLISVQQVVDGIRGLKQRPSETIFVAGIIGWPEYERIPQSQYRIDLASHEEPALWALSPLCSVPGIDAGDVHPSLRLKEFIQALGPKSNPNEGLFSMCSDPWEDDASWLGMLSFGGARPLCISYPLTDRDPDHPGVQPECQVSLSLAADDAGICGGQPAREALIPQCLDPATGVPVDPENPQPQLDAVPEDQRPCWYLVYDRDLSTGCPHAFQKQKLALHVKPGHGPPLGALMTADCLAEDRPAP